MREDKDGPLRPFVQFMHELNERVSERGGKAVALSFDYGGPEYLVFSASFQPRTPGAAVPAVHVKVEIQEGGTATWDDLVEALGAQVEEYYLAEVESITGS